MKRLTLLALAIGALMILPAGATDVLWSYGDFSQTIQKNRALDLYPVCVAATNSAGITAMDRIPVKTGSDGTVITYGLMPGFCKADFHGVWVVTPRWFQIPNTNGLVYARDCILTNGLPPMPGPVTPSVTGFSGTVTNLASIGAGVVTNYSYATNAGYAVSGAGSGGVNGDYTFDASSLGSLILSAWTNATGAALQYYSSGPYWTFLNPYQFYGTHIGTATTNTAAGWNYEVIAGNPPGPTVTATQFVTAQIIGYTTNAGSVFNSMTFTNGVLKTNLLYRSLN